VDGNADAASGRAAGGGELGYCMSPTRRDDCFQACVATVLQTPPEQVPDPRLDRRLAAGEDPEKISRESWTRFEEWLCGRGLQLVFHATVPVDRERWVGVCRAQGSEAESAAVDSLLARCGRDSTPFVDHTLVMSYGNILFDPSISVRLPPSMRLRSWHPSQVSYGISFDRLE
jgi:hypothetical protein